MIVRIISKYETIKKIVFVIGTRVFPKLKLDTNRLDFGSCSLNQNKIKSFTIVNKHTEIINNITFGNYSFFKFVPSSFKILPFSSQTVSVEVQKSMNCLN